MNQLAAFADTLNAAEHAGMDFIKPNRFAEGCDFQHLREMYGKALDGYRNGTFSDTKIARWLGWAQCAVMAADIGLTLENMKAINRRHA